MTKLMEEEIQPILVPAILEHEGIGGIPGVDVIQLFIFVADAPE